jgi:hypothetical protein
VFTLPLRRLPTAHYLQPLRTHVEGGEESCEYFEQCIPYIMEEVRANIEAQMKTISQKNLRPFLAKFESLIPLGAIKSVWQHILVQVKCKTSELPKLDHGFYNEAVLIVIGKKEKKNLHARQEGFVGLLVIASENNQQDEDDVNA